MTAPRRYGVVTLFAGLGGKTLGMLRARGPKGERFESVGAFDVDKDACRDFEHLTGAAAQVIDLGELSPAQLAERCSRRPDVVVLSPPCKGWSSCMSASKAATEKYQALNRLALRSIDLALEAWPTPPALFLLENVPRIISRGRDVLERMKALLRRAGYAVDLRVHDCGELGGLAQSRRRVLLVARHRELAPAKLLNPARKPMLSMGEVLWRLPVPLPGPSVAGALHRLPRLTRRNWLRLAAIRAGCDWRDLPASIELGGQRAQILEHAVHAEARTGKGWAETMSPRLASRPNRQNGGFGVNDGRRPAHAVVGEGSVGNTWLSISDVRLGCAPRDGTMGVLTPSRPSTTVLGSADIHNNSPATVMDPRVSRQHRGNYGVLDPTGPSVVVRASHWVRTAPASVADNRTGFEATHRLVTDQALGVTRKAWVEGAFELLGPRIDLESRSPAWLIILAPDGTIHRPMTPLELAALQGLPVWHRPGDPRELGIGADGGRWLELAGTRKAAWVERIGNAVPVQTAQAFGNEALAMFSACESEALRLPFAGVWVEPEREGVAA